MPDWTASMEQTFEYYTVDPGTWSNVKRLDTIISSNITFDMSSETLGSASFDATDVFGESYVRVYLVTTQNGVTERFCLGTYLVQTPSSSFNGKYTSVSMDAYTPLIELKEKLPPFGYYIPKDENIMDLCCRLVAENVRAPVVSTVSSETMYKDFVANTDDTWLSFLTDAIANAKYQFLLDEMGRILFAPKQDAKSMQPVWTFSDDNATSIVYEDIDIDHDIYGIPNTIEVIYSQNDKLLYSKAVNDDPTSPTSTISRGREILERVTNPEFAGIPTQQLIDEYAEQYLREISTLTYTVRYSHGYCPVRMGDCVRLNFRSIGLNGVNAIVQSQDLDCSPGAKVDETATFELKFWEG